MIEAINQFFSSNLVLAFCTLLGAFFGAYSGSHITAKSMRKQDHTHLMVEYWSEFVAAYSAFTSLNRSGEDRRDFIAATEKLRLFCPKESHLHFDTLNDQAVAPFPDRATCQEAYRNIRSAVNAKLYEKSIHLKQ